MKKHIIIVATLVFAISCNTKEAKKETKTNMALENPLLVKSTLDYGAPDFTKIKNKHFMPAILEGMKLQNETIKEIVENTEKATFKNTILSLEESSKTLDGVTAVFYGLAGANTNDTIKEVQKELAPKFSKHNDDILLNTALFARIKTVYNNLSSLQLDAESKHLVKEYYKNFSKAGADLSEDKKEKLKEINSEIASLANDFGKKLLDASKKGGVVIADKERLKGFSEEKIKSIEKDGKFEIQLINTSQQPSLQTLENREVRKELFEKSIHRSDVGEYDTSELVKKMVDLRAKKAEILGFENYASWSLQGTMASTPTKVFEMFNGLIPGALDKVASETKEIQAEINKEGKEFKLTAYDWNHYAEKVRKSKYNLNEAEVKPYFELTNVLEKGVFFAATKLYGITFKKRNDIPVYHPDVIVYELFEEDGSKLGLFYGDFFARDSKRGGAWMSAFVKQSKLRNQKPVVYNVCNSPKPAEGEPALISFDEVETMFHEFGHALHGLFGNQQYASISGTSTARDFVEFPSQFNENWSTHPTILNNYAVHYKTGEVIPAELLKKIKDAGTFNQGYSMIENLASSSLDMNWHTISVDTKIEDVAKFEEEALKKMQLKIAEVPPRYRSTYFAHVFSGGYAAGYYSYLWTEMLSHDAFDWFKDNGLLTRENGQKFREQVLSKGRKGAKAKINFTSQVGFTEKVKDNFTMMNALQKLQYEKELGRGGPGSTTVLKSEFDRLANLDHNWQDDLLKTGFIKSNGISISGGSDKSTYFVSFKSESDTGIIDGLDGFDRTTGRVNLTSEVNDWLDLRVTTGVAHTFSTEPRDRNNVQNPFAAMYSYNAYEPLYSLDSSGQPILDANGNPIYNLTSSGFAISEAIRNNPSSEENLRLIGSAGLDFKFFDSKLIYTPQISLTYNTLRAEAYTQPGSVLDGYVGDSEAPGSKTDNGSSSFTYNILNKVTYRDTFGDVHNFGATLFTEFYNNNFRDYRVASKGFPTADLNTQDNSAEPTGARTRRSEETLFSIAALADYNYDEKYIFSASLRRDGSSRFGDNQKYGVFWAASAAWNIHKESFFKADFVDKLKMRVSYGTSGNDRVPGRYASLGVYAFSNYNGASAAYPDRVANPDLKWESKTSLDLGVDFSLFGRKLNGVVNYFNSKTEDLLFNQNLAQESGQPGTPSRFVNLGKISSQGLEVELNGDIIRNNNFSWNLGANIAFVRTMVDELPEGADFNPASYPNIILREGEEMNSHYLVRYAGVNPANGRALYYDKNDNITENYSPNDAVLLKDKSPSPDFDGSLNTILDYKGITLSANMYFKYGNYIYNNQEAQHLADGNSINSNQRLDAFNFWRNPGDTNVLPDARNSANISTTSDRFLQDGSYLRLRSVKLGYSLPKKWLGENGFFSNVNMYLQGQNLWTYSPYFKGDPEVGIGSEESIGRNSVGFIPGAANLNSYPTIKSFLLGVDVTF